MKKNALLTLAVASTLLAGNAFAADATKNMTTESVKQMDDKAAVTLSGIVDSVDNEREFTIKDDKGSIGVDLAEGQSIVLKKGQHVTVTGTVDNDLGVVDINATNIDTHQNLGQKVSDAVKSVDGVSTMNAQAYNIKDLPKTGMVKVTGYVDDVDDEKEFTLKDDSGSIEVELHGTQKAALAEGSKVTVIGAIDNGMLGKSISAKQVIVVENAKTAQK